MKPHAASMLLSPWGLLSVGGMVQGKGVGAVPDVWAIDPVSKLWRGVPIEDGVTSPPAGRWAIRARYGGTFFIVAIVVRVGAAFTMPCGEQLHTIFEVELQYESDCILREFMPSQPK